MGDPAGYQWKIESLGPDWFWTVRGADGAVLLRGGALNRAHAAACVVRALVQGMTATQPLARAA